jgi:hypothetical protein
MSNNFLYDQSDKNAHYASILLDIIISLLNKFRALMSGTI